MFRGHGRQRANPAQVCIRTCSAFSGGSFPWQVNLKFVEPPPQVGSRWWLPEDAPPTCWVKLLLPPRLLAIRPATKQPDRAAFPHSRLMSLVAALAGNFHNEDLNSISYCILSLPSIQGNQKDSNGSGQTSQWTPMHEPMSELEGPTIPNSTALVLEGPMPP